MQCIKAIFVAILTSAPCLAFTFTINTRTSFVDRHDSKLHMVGEIVEGANAALNALPLLAGPTAALAAGQAALSQKKKIESEVEFAERELDDVKRRLKNTDTLINGSFGLAVVSAGFVAVQAFGGESLSPQNTLESIEKPQEFVLPSSSQQLAAADQKPATESIKELMKVDTSIPEKKVETSASDYNALYKSIESAGKEGSESVEKIKASVSVSPISTVTTSEVKELSGGKNNKEAIVAEKSQEASANNAKDKIDSSASKASAGEKVLSAVAIENKNTEGVQSAKASIEKSLVTPTVALNEKVDESPTKTPSEEKSLSATATENKNTEVVLSPVKATIEKSQVPPTIAAKEKGDELVAKTPLSEKVSTANEVSSPSTKVIDITLSKDELKPQTKVAIDSTAAKNGIEKAAPIVAVEKGATSLVDALTTTTTTSTPVLSEKSLAQRMEAAGKAGGDTVQQAEPIEKGTTSLADMAPTTTTASIDKIAPTSNDEKSLAIKMEAAGKAGSDVVQTKNTVLPDKQTVDSSSEILSKNIETKPDDATTTIASIEKIVPISTSKSESSDEKSLALRMEAAGKAGSDLIQPATIAAIPDKQTVDSSPSYDSLFKKIEAAGKASDESAKTTDISAEQGSASGSPVIASPSEIGGASTNKLDIKKPSDEVNPVVPSLSLKEDAPQDSSSSGVYMKEAVSALSSLGLPKLVGPSSNSPDYKLPTFNAPELSMPNFNMPDLKMPSLNVPELSLPGISIPSMEDVPLAAKVAAGVFAVGGTGVAIALSLTGEETVGSTMPIGAKKKGTSYLEGLSRSSTTLPNKSPNGSSSSSGSNSYLSNLASNAVSPPQGQATSAPFDFSPKPFDSRTTASNNNERPVLTAIQESNVSPSFNFAPTSNANTINDNVATPVNGGNNLGGPNGEKKKDSGSPSFNFSPKLFDLANKRGTLAENGQGGNANLGPKPEPPMGGENSSNNGKSDKYDWGNSSVDGGYVWRDPVQQNTGSGVGSYLDNLAAKSVGPNPDASPTNPNGGSYNSYLDAMNRQPNQEYQGSNQPSTIKSFSKTPRTGSYVDSL